MLYFQLLYNIVTFRSRDIFIHWLPFLEVYTQNFHPASIHLSAANWEWIYMLDVVSKGLIANYILSLEKVPLSVRRQLDVADKTLREDVPTVSIHGVI
jgi:hypothetical protein